MLLTNMINVTKYIVIRNDEEKKHGPYCWYFCLNLKYLGWPYREYIKTAKNDGFCEELLCESDFWGCLAIFYCYDYDVNASEAVQIKKIVMNALLCYSLLDS